MTEQEPQEAPAWKRALVAALAAFGLIMVMTAASIVFAWLEARERGGAGDAGGGAVRAAEGAA